jgi:hypothetical protein
MKQRSTELISSLPEEDMATRTTVDVPKSAGLVLEASDVSRLALLAYQVANGKIVDPSTVDELDTAKARNVGRAVLGLPTRDSATRSLAKDLLAWARSGSGNSGVV